MAIGGNIKVTLTLDDAGFTVKTQQAAKGIQSMNTEISGFSTGLKTAEATIKKFGENIQTVSQSFTALDGYAKDASKSLTTLAASGAALDKTTAGLVASFGNLQGVVTQLSAKLLQTSEGMGAAGKAGDALSGTNARVGQSATAAADGLTRQERAARNLGSASSTTAKQVQLSALASKDAAAQQLAGEIAKNDKMVASKRTALASMIRAEQEYNRQLEAAKAQAMATSMRVDSKRLPNGRLTSVNSDYMRDLRIQLDLELRQVQALQQSVNLIGQEAAKMQTTITTTQQRNAALREGIALRERDLANIQRYNTAMREGNLNVISAERAKRAEIAQQNAMVREQLGLVKSLGQMWASMKIYQGEKASVNSAGEYERNVIRAQAMGLNDKEMTQFKRDNIDDSSQHSGVSYKEAAEARLAVMGGIASKDRNQVNALLPGIIEASKNIQFLTGDNSHENFRDQAQNLTGFIDARQQQYDPVAAKSTMDLVTQANAATGGKINLQDFETLARRTGSANQISDEGWRNIIALADQYKVSGGGGGGGAGGLSTVGTMIKMLTSYGVGKTKTNQSVQQLVEAGILDTTGTDPAKSFGAQMKFLKNAGFKDQRTLTADPVKAFMQISDAAFKSMTSNKKQVAKYFGSEDADTKDPELRRSAMQKWATRMGYSTTASGMLSLAGDPRFQERVHHENEMIKGSKTNEGMSKDRIGSYQGSLDAFTASIENLKIALGTSILPLMTSFVNSVNQLVKAGADFATNVPMAAELTMIAGALAGAALGLKGLMGMMGLVAKAGATFGIFGTGARAASIATGGLGAAAGAILNPLTVMRGTITGVSQAGSTWATTMAAANLRLASTTASTLPLIGAQFRFLGTAITSTLGFIGKAFLRAIPFVGWLIMAWDLGGLLWNLEIGGSKISEWLTKWLADLYGWARIGWEKIKGIFDMDEAAEKATAAAIAGIKKEADVRQKAFEQQRQNTQAQKDADDKAKKDADDKAHAGVNDLNNQTQGALNNPYGPPQDVDWGGGEKPQRGFEDPFTSSLAEMRKSATINAQKAGAAIADTGNDLASEARIAFKEKWIAGDFDPGHDPNKRQFKGANGELDWNAKGAAGSPQDWVDQYVEMKKAEDQLKSMQFVKQRIAGAEEDFRNAMERTSGETGKQNRDIAALERELARAGERLKTGTADWAAWSAEKNHALEVRTGAVLVNFTADFADDDRKSQADLMPDGYSKQAAEMDAAILQDREQYEQLATSHKKYYDDEVADYKRQLDAKQIDNALYNQKVTEATQRYTSSAAKSETAFTQHVAVQNQLRLRATETALQKQTRDWQNTYSALDSATAEWANGLMDNLSTALTGGRADWKSFLTGMLKDLMSIKLKESLGGVVSGLFGGVQQMMNGTLFNNASTQGSGGGLASGVATIGSGVMSMFGGGTGAGATTAGTAGATGAGAAAATNQLATAADTATTGLQNMSQTGITGAIMSIGQWVISLFTGTAASTAKSTADMSGVTGVMTLTSAMFEASLAATNLSLSLAAAATTSTATAAFANGGIMSSSGSLSLMKYANGGVANKPQLALFGEGRMNEAYVPLPDGRSIPVTMKGDATTTAGAGQTVNSVMIEINVSGEGGDTTAKSGSSGGNDKTWDTMAQRVKGIVMEVIANEKRPNGALTK